MNKITRLQKNTNGFSIVEIIIYFSLLAIISTLVITNIISLFKNYNIVRSNQEIEYNAIAIFDKLTRNVRDAGSINISDSSFSVAQGAVSLSIASTTNPTASTTVKIYLDSNKIKYMQNGVVLGNLSTNAVKVSSFRVYYISASSSEAIKVEMNLEVSPRFASSTISKNFYTTIQLRE